MVVSNQTKAINLIKSLDLTRTSEYLTEEDILKTYAISNLVEDLGLNVLANLSKEDYLQDTNLVKHDIDNQALAGVNHLSLQVDPNTNTFQYDKKFILKDLTKFVVSILDNNLANSELLEYLNLSSLINGLLAEDKLGIYYLYANNVTMLIFYQKAPVLVSQAQLDEFQAIKDNAETKELTPDEFKDLNNYANDLTLQYNQVKTYMEQLLTLVEPRVLDDEFARAIFKQVNEARTLLDY